MLIMLVTRYVFTVLGNMVSWKGILQHILTLSIIEFKYIALIKAIKKAKSTLIIRIIGKFGLKQ